MQKKKYIYIKREILKEKENREVVGLVCNQGTKGVTFVTIWHVINGIFSHYTTLNYSRSPHESQEC